MVNRLKNRRAAYIKVVSKYGKRFKRQWPIHLGSIGVVKRPKDLWRGVMKSRDRLFKTKELENSLDRKFGKVKMNP